ncbi:hypothetical protein Tco_0060141 [Tanacetum coccineum]
MFEGLQENRYMAVSKALDCMRKVTCIEMWQLYNHVIMIDYSPLLFPNFTHVFCDQTSTMDIGNHQIRDERKKMVLTVQWKQMQMGKARGLSKQKKGPLT